VSPASLGDLLEAAEVATVRLISARLSLEELAPSWPAYTEATERILRSCVGVRESNNPVDAALSETAAAARTAHTRAPHSRRLSISNDLTRIGELFSAAADLLTTHPTPEPAAAQLAGLRAAGVVAAASHMVVVAERTRAPEGIALRALRLERVATTALAQPVILLPLDEPRAAPATEARRSVGERYEAAALAWRRLAAEDFNPSTHVLRVGARSIAHITDDLRLVLRAAGIVDTDLDERLQLSRTQWQAVGESWQGITTAAPLVPDARTAAAELQRSSAALQLAVRAGLESGDTHGLAELQAAVRRGHRDAVALGQDQLALTRRLGTAGRLFVPARELPGAEERLAATLRRQYVAAPPERVGRLIEPYVAATTSSSNAVGASDRVIAAAAASERSPQRAALAALATRPPQRGRPV
jgi:hypothetical protein